MKRRDIVAALVALVMMTAGLAGCLEDEGDDGVDWDKPTQVMVDKAEAVNNDTLSIRVHLYDASDYVTEWDVNLRVMIWDSLDFEMYNKSMDIKAKDFETEETAGVVDTFYKMDIPFTEIEKSNDRVAGFLTGKEMRVFAWITVDGTDYKQDPEGFMVTSIEIPDELLNENVAPVADLTGPTSGWIDQDLEFNASGSTDDLGFDDLDFEWDWGDGTTSWLFPTDVEFNSWSEPGTYTVTVNVTDGDGAWDTATLDVTISDPISVTVDDWGVVDAMGDHYNDTWVEFTISNAADYAWSISLDPMLMNATDGELSNNGTEAALPTEVPAEDSVTVKMYFIAPEGFEPTKIMIMDMVYDLPV